MSQLQQAAETINAGCDRLRAVVADPNVWSTALVLLHVEQLRAEALTALGVETCPPLPPDSFRVLSNERWS